MTKNNNKEFNSFSSFYPYYLAEHKNKTCRRLHFVGSTLVLGILVYSIFSAQWELLWLLPVAGYGFAWVGHFFFEKNKPATFQYPLYSLMGDWVMYKDIIRGKVPW
ncbi:DUF962 domain-containing protein [Pseudoalteromonas piscicida]|uniref:DUF962 domain-containing protein n=1 Tax=Pseudoalteromonas piscicida TaxID=43662 RepID=A0A2A5JP58_PSEO7|nr:DUF962 domain-containing protein [Pseudoalteromonas piscicida]PCK31232.1 hypothetical protein CEX98_13460 [Pseudoalteromonas piscicida]